MTGNITISNENRLAAQAILADPRRIVELANLLGFTIEATTTALATLLSMPEVNVEKIESYIYKEASSDLRAYYSGQQIEYKKGVEAGFAKGVAATVAIGGAALLIAALSKSNYD